MRLIVGVLLVLLGGAGLLLEQSASRFDQPETFQDEAPPLKIEALSGSPGQSVSTGDYWQTFEEQTDSADTCANKTEMDLFVRDK